MFDETTPDNRVNNSVLTGELLNEKDLDFQVSTVPIVKPVGKGNKRSMAEVQAYLDSNKFNDHVKEDSDEED